MPRNIAPSIKIKTDLEADVSIFTEYLTHPKRVSYRQLILKAHPALTQSLAGQPQRKVRTLAIFRSVGLLAPNRVDYYSGKKALVGYDQKNDVAVVIKALKKDNKEEE